MKHVVLSSASRSGSDLEVSGDIGRRGFSKDQRHGVNRIVLTGEHLILLQWELADKGDCLFVFVEHPEVEPTNNRTERNARHEVEIRRGA